MILKGLKVFTMKRLSLFSGLVAFFFAIFNGSTLLNSLILTGVTMVWLEQFAEEE